MSQSPQGHFSTSQISSFLYDKPNCPAPSLTHTHTVAFSPGEHAEVMAEQIAMRELCAGSFQTSTLRTGGLQVSLERSWVPVDWGRGQLIESSPPHLLICNRQWCFFYPSMRTSFVVTGLLWDPSVSPCFRVCLSVSHWVSGGKKRRSVCCS